jgi:predicted HAD superfamily Cof-like phosphohydrolase
LDPITTNSPMGCQIIQPAGRLAPPDYYGDVLAFHRKFGCSIGARPAEPDEATVKLRVSLISEEVTELVDAIDRGDIAEIADGGGDLIFVVIGTLISYGISLDPVWRAIAAANLAKEGGGKREDMKILKPVGWQAPDIEAIIGDQPSLAELYPDWNMIPADPAPGG